MRSLSAVAMRPGPLDLGCPKLTTGRITAFGLGKRPASVRRLEPIELWVPARAVLALLLALEAVRTGCVPTCVVLTGDCWGERDRERETRQDKKREDETIKEKKQEDERGETEEMKVE